MFNFTNDLARDTRANSQAKPKFRFDYADRFPNFAELRNDAQIGSLYAISINCANDTALTLSAYALSMIGGLYLADGQSFNGWDMKIHFSRAAQKSFSDKFVPTAVLLWKLCKTLCAALYQAHDEQYNDRKIDLFSIISKVRG